MDLDPTKIRRVQKIWDPDPPKRVRLTNSGQVQDSLPSLIPTIDEYSLAGFGNKRF